MSDELHSTDSLSSQFDIVWHRMRLQGTPSFKLLLGVMFGILNFAMTMPEAIGIAFTFIYIAVGRVSL